MSQKYTIPALLIATLALAACEDGNDGLNGADGADGFNSLVATRTVPRGDSVCLGGGLALDSGLDTNRNDVLDPDEVTATEYLECAATPQVRALHASADAPPVNILVNGAQALAGVDFGAGSGFLPGVEEVNVQVEAIIPGGNAVVIDADLSLDYSTEYTIIAVDNVAGIRPLVIANPSDDLIPTGNFAAQVVHAAAAAEAVDVYVTTPGADLTASAPVNSAPLAFEEFTPRLEVPEGDYQIRITPTGDASTVVYDSGTVSLAAGADLLIAAIDNVGLGDSAVQLVVLDGAGASTLYDAATPAAAVAVHLSPDAPAVDILADDDATPNDDAIRLATNVSFTEFCVIEPIPAPADYTLSVVANADNSTVALQFPFAATVDGAATAIVSGFLATSTPAITAIPLAVDPRSVITETKLRLTHASPSTGDVDIYLLAAGTNLDDPIVQPNFAAVPFGADTGVLSIAPDTYDVYVTPAGDKSVRAIEVTGLALTGGLVWDVIARDPATDGSEGMLPLPLIVDYAAAPDCT